MKVGRIGALFAAVALIAIAVVQLRAEQARVAADSLQLEGSWMELRRELCELRASVARLRSPERIHDRVDWFYVEVEPPEGEFVNVRRERVALNGQ